MEEIREGGQLVARYRYDGLGRRVERSEGGRTTRYLYDGWNVAQEVEEGVANPLLSGLGLDQHYGRTEQGRRVYALRDHLGSVRALTNAEGQVVARYEYTPYGVTTSSVPGDRQPYRYTGREQDASGLYYYRARYYHPGMGRFLSEDPIGLAVGINPYAYVGGNPMMYTDPLGLWQWPMVPQPVVDGVTGFGDGVYSAITFGIGDLQDVRDALDIDGGFDSCSDVYQLANLAGSIEVGFALGGAGWRGYQRGWE